MGNRFFKALFPLLVLGAGIALALFFVAHPDKAKKRLPEAPQALLVETARAQKGVFPAFVEAVGQIVPSKGVSLKAQISGEILAVSDKFVPGGFFSEGEEMLRIDAADFELEVLKKRAALQQAEADLALEMGRQDIAREEIGIVEKTLGRKLEEPHLALRAPQLAQAQAHVKSAAADLDKALLDLRRTKIVAPFNLLLTERFKTQGDKVTNADDLAHGVGTDEYWLDISLPLSDLPWLEVPQQEGDQASLARIIFDDGRGEREGRVFKMTGMLGQETRLARLLISVPDPLLLEGKNAAEPVLILKDFVQVILQGRVMKNVLRVPLLWMREKGMIWVNDNGKLSFHSAEILYKDRAYAYICAGLEEEDEIVISDIPVPVEGMALRTLQEVRSNIRSKMKGPKGTHDGDER